MRPGTSPNLLDREESQSLARRSFPAKADPPPESHIREFPGCDPPRNGYVIVVELANLHFIGDRRRDGRPVSPEPAPAAQVQFPSPLLRRVRIRARPDPARHLSRPQGKSSRDHLQVQIMERLI